MLVLYITVDFAADASQNGVCICITKQICHKTILFHNCSIIKDESNENI